MTQIKKGRAITRPCKIDRGSGTV